VKFEIDGSAINGYDLLTMLQTMLQQQYSKCESKCDTHLKKLGLFIMCSGQYQHTIDWSVLMQEIKTPNSILDYLASSRESHKLMLNMFRDTDDPIDFFVMSSESHLSTWMIDIYGQLLDWVTLLNVRQVPDYLIKKHQNKFDEAIGNLLSDIL
jgi:hypothetical protein